MKKKPKKPTADIKPILTNQAAMMMAMAYLMEERIGASTISTELRNLAAEAKERASK